MQRIRILLSVLLCMLVLLSAPAALAGTITVNAGDYLVEEDGWYDSMEEVAVYLTFFEELPDNYLTKKEAEKLGWVSSKGNLHQVAKGCSIGGNRFGNYEGLLPEAKGRSYTECDIDYRGGRRNAKRIVFSNDGLIFYTDDHYASFDEIEVVWLDDESDEKEKTETVKTDKKQSAAREEESLKETDELVSGVVDVLYWLFAE